MKRGFNLADVDKRLKKIEAEILIERRQIFFNLDGSPPPEVDGECLFLEMALGESREDEEIRGEVKKLLSEGVPEDDIKAIFDQYRMGYEFFKPVEASEALDNAISCPGDGPGKRQKTRSPAG